MPPLDFALLGLGGPEKNDQGEKEQGHRPGGETGERHERRGGAVQLALTRPYTNLPPLWV